MKIVCPEGSCRKENEASAMACVRCGMPLQNYAQLLNYPAYLFNQGLRKARHGELEQARDLFAAVVYWCPNDLEARNALAMACLGLHDLLEARRQWELVLTQAPADTLAQRGINQIETQSLPEAFSSIRPSAPGTARSPAIGKHTGKSLFLHRRKKKER